MKQNTVHDVAKFLSGLVLGDFLSLWWLASNNDLPAQFLGITVTNAAVVPGMVFDAGLFIILVYYGWHLGKMPAVRERTYHLIAGVIFGIVAIVHLIRAVSGADIVIVGWEVPIWLSWVATVAAGVLSYLSFHLALSRRR